MNTEAENVRMLEFEKLDTGKKFYTANPTNVPETAAYIKIPSQKDAGGKWANAKNAFGFTNIHPV